MAIVHSFSRQIRATVVWTSTIAIVMAMVAAFFVMLSINRSIAAERAQVLASITAANAQAAVSLRDVDRGRDLLAPFASAKSVLAARVLDTANSVFVEYTKAGKSPDPSIFSKTRDDVKVARAPIEYGGENLGVVEVVVDADLLQEFSKFLLLATVGVMALVLAGIWLLARPIEARISKPITGLSHFTRRIRDSKDYALRIPLSPVKELRGLTEDLNDMLGVIERAHSEQAQRSTELSKLAFYDQLTGAANRSLFRDRLSQCVNDYNRSRRPFSLIGIDLDKFKQLNDNHGHAVGDDYLREVAARCIAALRPSDTFARMGGDEFVVLLPAVDRQSDALAVAQKLSVAVREANQIHKKDTICTASIGVGLFPFDAPTPTELIAKVDAAMYRAKSNGRDQIVPITATATNTGERPQPNPADFTRYSG
jgi:diguanylate cyclase